MSNLERLLERIAIALENINPRPQTAFPWGDNRIDARLHVERHWRGQRPETFEELLSIGRSSLMRGSSGRTRNIGEKSIRQLDVIFKEYGFGERWMLS